MNKLLLLCFLSSIWWNSSAQTLLPGQPDAGTGTQVAPKLLSVDAKPAQPQTAQAKALTGNEVILNMPYPEYWPDRVFVRMKDQQGGQLQTYESKAARLKTATGKVNTALRRYETNRVTELPKSAKLASFKNTYEVVVDKPEQLNQLLAELNAMPEVAYAERVPLYYTSTTPNDPMYASGQQYAMNKIDAFGAAGIHTGTTKTLLAIVDDAVLISHPDLQSNVDVTRSYDVADRDNDPRPPASGTNRATANSFSHGTHCAGIAGAVTNNGVGVASVSNNKVSIIGIKCTSDLTADSRLIERSVEGIVHAINQGARVISMSFGGTGASQTVQHIINEATANGVVFVAAAGNSNIEARHYPAAYDNVIAVASTDASDLKSSFSNYGTWIDVSAPGSNIFSTVANGSAGEYISYNGTSMSTPMVAGLVALMLSQNPDLTAQAVAQILRNTADPIDNVAGQAATLAGKLGAGRINAFKAIQAIKALTPTAAPTAVTDLSISRTTRTEADLTWTAPGIGGTAPAVLYDIRYATTPITAANFSSATRTVTNITPGQPGATQALTVSGLTPGTTYYFALVARSLYGDGSPLSNMANSSTLAAPSIQVSAGTVTAFNINRDNGTTASGTFTVTNTGTEPLAYSLNFHAKTGTNMAAHDKLQNNSDSRFGYSGSSFITAARFVAGPRGFNLSHVQNFIYNATAVNSTVIGVRILKGGTTPANAILLATQNFTTAIPAGGEQLTFKLQQEHQIQPGEVFWVAFVLPAGLSSPQGIDNTGAKSGTFYISSNGGASYSDAQAMATFLNTMAFKIRAVNAGWASMTPASGSILAGQSREVTVAIDAATIVNGTYQADILFTSDAPLTPVVSRPVTVTVTGGQATIAVENTSVNYGSLFVGTSGTAKVMVSNTGVAALNITAATFNGGAFPAADFAMAPAFPIIIQPNAQQELSINFTPSRKEALAGTVSLASNDAAAPSVAINLLATLINPPVSVVTANDMNLVLNKTTATTATRTIKIQNTGEALLQYSLQLLPDPANTLAYDADGNADNFLGLNTTTIPLHIAVKFTVTTPRFTLAQVQNYYRSQTTATQDVTLKIYKGGAMPAPANLLLQQTVNDAASASNGALIIVPLLQQQQFVQGDVFWVVFVHTGVNSPQGASTGTPPAYTNYYSTDGNSWTAWTASNFKIRALGAPSWLNVAAFSGSVLPAGEENVSVMVNAADLEEGNYTGRIAVVSNSYQNPQERIQLNLHVTQNAIANPTALHKDMEELEGVAAYPNPSSGRFMLELRVHKPEDLQVRLLTLTGHVVFEETHQSFSGDYKQQVNTGKFAAGIYLLQVQQGNKLYTQKLMIR